MEKISFKNWLAQEYIDVKESESSALEALQAGDLEKYRSGMRERAGLLKDLYRKALPRLNELSPDEGQRVGQILDGFSRNAATALSLDSIFYMSALLYPDEHKSGEPDNFKKLLESLEQS